MILYCSQNNEKRLSKNQESAKIIIQLNEI